MTAAALPTADQARALHQFIQDRNEEEWQQALAAEDLPEAHFETVRRLTNSHRLALAGTVAYLLAALGEGQNGQAAALWDNLTACGEQWQDHPQWRPAWRNPARAALNASLGIPE